MLLALLFIVVSETEYQYKKNHIMIYTPTTEEEKLLADEFGVVLNDGLSISEVLLDFSHSEVESKYTIRITGVDDAYSFLTTNLVVEEEVAFEDGCLLINGSPVYLDSTIYNYEGTQAYSGGSITLWIWGGHNVNNNSNPYKYPVKISFFYEEDELLFVECGCRTYPFGNECNNQIRIRHYWEDYYFYPLFPFFK